MQTTSGQWRNQEDGRKQTTLGDTWLRSPTSPPHQAHDSFNYTTSVLMSASESLNELRNKRTLEATGGSNAFVSSIPVDDDFYNMDDDDTKVIIIKSPFK